jgi:predicted enzyme related to lactoylglutathione lyase/DNA-binding transcriptional ArsR family regulator
MTTQSYIPYSLCHFDIAGPDLEALGTFYASVFKWSIDSRGPGYTLVQTPAGGPNGALVESDEPALTIGIVVPDLDRTLATATTHGGKITMPITDNGWVKKAQIIDPVGNCLTLIQGWTIEDHQLDEILRALAHPDRRTFVRAAMQEACSAGQLADLSALALASVSEHLKVLRKTGILVLEKRGRYRFYRANSKLIRETAGAISRLQDSE